MEWAQCNSMLGFRNLILYIILGKGAKFDGHVSNRSETT